MKLYEIFFSPTGGTKETADILARELGGEVEPVNLTSRAADVTVAAPGAEDLAVIAVPSFGGRVPAVAVQRLAAMQGGGAAAVLVCVYGNRAFEDTLVELRDAAVEAGFRPVAAVAAVAEHSIARQFAAGRPDEADRQQLTEFAARIREKLAAKNNVEPALPGNRPYKKAGGAGMVPKPARACTRCGVCAKECPVGAIDSTDPHRVNKDLCISCMRCVAVCPHGARKLNPMMLSAAGMILKKACSDRKECELFL